MKLLNITRLIVIMLLGLNKVNAQVEVIGFWKTELHDDRGEIETAIIDFNKNGKLIIEAKDYGIWSYNNTEKTITINSEFTNINGVSKVEKLDDKQMVLLNTEIKKNIFERISLPNGQEYNNKITGTYILKKVYENGKLVNETEDILIFKNNGIIMLNNYIFGSWKYNKKEEELIFFNIARESINGNYKIENKGKELIITANSFKMAFERLNLEEVYKKNKTSGLAGLWRFEVNNMSESGKALTETHYLLLENPNLFHFGTTGATHTSSGIWIKDDKKISFIGSFFNFSGENEILEITDNKILFKNKKGKIFTAIKVKQGVNTIEQLNYNKENYFKTTDSIPKLKIDKTKIPWNNTKSNIEYLKNIKSLEYKTYRYDDKYNVVGVEKSSISFQSYLPMIINVEQSIFENPYPIMLHEDMADYQPFILFKEILSGKIIGQDRITTPAGTFECTVIEGYTDFETEVKLWMINNKPGVFAKIIISENDTSGNLEYVTYILDEIIKK